MNIREIFGKKRLLSPKGLTLVEMLIAMLIFSTILIGTLLLIKYIYKNYGYVMEQGLSLNEVQKGLKLLESDIRGARPADSGAYPIVSADKFDFVFYTDIDKDKVTERVHYYFQDNSIKKGVTNPTGTPPSYPSEDQATTTLVTHVINTVDEPLFYFYDTNYPTDQVNNPIAFPVSDVSKIRMVKIDMFYNLNPFRAPDNIRLESFVGMRNLKDNW
jgi:prepilin-type N-terminal cleavage/methylation domain-containing protein